MEFYDNSVAAYLDYCIHRKKLSAKTIKAYSIDLTQFTLFAEELPPQEIKAVISAYIAHLHDTFLPRTVKRKLASLKAFFSYLEFEELISENPFHKTRTKFQETQLLPRTIPLNTIQEILMAAYEERNNANTVFAKRAALRDIAALELLFATGLRVSELCSLSDENVNMDDGSLLIMGKGSRERVLQIGNNEVLAALNCYTKEYLPYIKATGYFFVNRLGAKLSEQSVRFMVKRYCEKAKIELHITPHMFRYSFATLLLEEDVDIRYIQRMLGHSSIQTTQIYTQVSSEKQRQILTAKHPRNKILLGM
jgi:integrase/recombinase XerD